MLVKLNTQIGHQRVDHYVHVMQADIEEVHRRLKALKPPDSGPPDAVSKLWASHLSPQVLAQLAGNGSAQQGRSVSADQLRARFPEYHQQYGY